MIETVRQSSTVRQADDITPAIVESWFVEAAGVSHCNIPEKGVCERVLPLLLEMVEEAEGDMVRQVRAVDRWAWLPWYEAGIVPQTLDQTEPRCQLIRQALAGLGVRREGRPIVARTIAKILKADRRGGARRERPMRPRFKKDFALCENPSLKT